MVLYISFLAFWSDGQARFKAPYEPGVESFTPASRALHDPLT